jgi:hypothetical protein
LVRAAEEQLELFSSPKHAVSEEKLADVQRLREDERRDLSERVEDLRRERDDLRRERDRLLKVIEEQAGSVRLLTDQRVEREPKPRRWFWQRRIAAE